MSDRIVLTADGETFLALESRVTALEKRLSANPKPYGPDSEESVTPPPSSRAAVGATLSPEQVAEQNPSLVYRPLGCARCGARLTPHESADHAKACQGPNPKTKGAEASGPIAGSGPLDPVKPASALADDQPVPPEEPEPCGCEEAEMLRSRVGAAVATLRSLEATGVIGARIRERLLRELGA